MKYHRENGTWPTVQVGSSASVVCCAVLCIPHPPREETLVHLRELIFFLLLLPSSFLPSLERAHVPTTEKKEKERERLYIYVFFVFLDSLFLSDTQKSAPVSLFLFFFLFSSSSSFFVSRAILSNSIPSSELNKKL